MDIVPIYGSRQTANNKTLPVGVKIRYEEDDAEHLVHILRFLESYAKEHGKKFTLMPTVTHNDKNTKCGALLREFEKLGEGTRIIVGVIAVEFLDEMRPVFEAYNASLTTIKSDAENGQEWDEDHPFFFLTNYFDFIARRFFPKKTTMH